MMGGERGVDVGEGWGRGNGKWEKEIGNGDDILLCLLPLLTLLTLPFPGDVDDGVGSTGLVDQGHLPSYSRLLRGLHPAGTLGWKQRWNRRWSQSSSVQVSQ